MAFISWIAILLLSISTYCNADVVRAEFESCPACRLNSLPQVKRFFYKVVQKGVYPKVTIKWLHGRTPELVLYDENNKEVERMFVDKLTFNDLHTLLRQKGFKPKDDDSSLEDSDKPQLATVLQQPTNEATSTDSQTNARRLRAHNTAARLLKALSHPATTRSLDLDA